MTAAIADDSEPCTKRGHQVSLLHLLSPRAGPSGTRRELSAACRQTRSRPSSQDRFGIISAEPADSDDAALIRDHVVRVEVRSDRLIIELTNAKGAIQSESEPVNGSRCHGARRHRPGAGRSWCPNSVAPQAKSARSVPRTARFSSPRLREDAAGSTSLLADSRYRPSRHRSTRGLQRAQGQHDDLARLPRARSRQGSDRRTSPAWHGRGQLCELPAEWSRQYHMLGLTAP